MRLRATELAPCLALHLCPLPPRRKEIPLSGKSTEYSPRWVSSSFGCFVINHFKDSSIIRLDCFLLLWGPPFNSVSDLECKPSTIRSTSNKGPGSMRGNIAAGDAGERGAVNYFKHAIFPMNCLSEEQPLERLVCMHQ